MESFFRCVNYFIRYIVKRIFLQKRKKEIKRRDRKGVKKAIGVLWRWLQWTANEIPLVHSALNSCAFVLCSLIRGCETRGQITLASLRGAAYLAHGIIFLYSTVSRIPLWASSFLHVRNGHHVLRCLWHEIKKKKRISMVIHDMYVLRVRFDSGERTI